VVKRGGMSIEPICFDSKNFSLNENNISRLISTNLNEESAEKMLTEKTNLAGLVLFRQVENQTILSFKRRNEISHVPILLKGAVSIGNILNTQFRNGFQVIIKDDKELKSDEEIEFFQQHSFAPLGSEVASQIIKKKACGTYMFWVLDMDGADGEDKTYVVSSKVESGRVVHTCLQKDGRPMNLHEIAGAIKVLELKYGVTTFFSNNNRLKSARSVIN